MLPSAIDDIDMRVTHVVRGEDHVSNTAAQIQMFEALGAVPPTFAHEALLVGSEGKLSKRLGSLGADHFRELGIEPIALVALLARIGTSEPVIPVNDVAPLIETFDFAHFGRAPARFDDDELKLLNQKIVHGLDYDAVAARLPADIGAAGWEAIRPNLHTVGEAADIWSCVTGPIAPPPFDDDTRAYCAAAADQAASINWAGDPWHALTGALKAATDRKGKALFLPLRQALTGRDSGPDMAALLPLIGRDRAIERFRAAAQG
jgi:glutamyl-tRNA synthetase